MSDFKEIEQLAETMKAEKEAPMAERPTPEQIEDIRFDLSHEQPSDVLAEWVVSLLAEVDALTARAVAAEQDASDTRDDLIEALEHMTSIAATLSLPGTVTGDRLVEEVRRLHAAATATGEHYSWINHGIRAEKERDEARANLVAAEQRAETAELALAGLRDVVAAYLLADLSDDITTTAAELRGPK